MVVQTMKQLPPAALFKNIRGYRAWLLKTMETLEVEARQLETWIARPPLNAKEEDHMMIHTLMAFNRRCFIAAQEGIAFVIESQRYQEERIRHLKEEMRMLEDSMNSGELQLSHDEMAAMDITMESLDREYALLTGSSIYEEEEEY